MDKILPYRLPSVLAKSVDCTIFVSTDLVTQLSQYGCHKLSSYINTRVLRIIQTPTLKHIFKTPCVFKVLKGRNIYWFMCQNEVHKALESQVFNIRQKLA